MLPLYTPVANVAQPKAVGGVASGRSGAGVVWAAAQHHVMLRRVRRLRLRRWDAGTLGPILCFRSGPCENILSQSPKRMRAPHNGTRS